MAAHLHDPRIAVDGLIQRAAREPWELRRCVLRRFGNADTLTIRDEVRIALGDDTITEAAVDRILSAHREAQRLFRGAA
ncbi:hypothetical protein [Methylobacterium sp. C1]|uniref:hypothetical protein n=1 Tax=Methylobacterium sp. C1 TaxID=1479019 RepID=UPI0008D98B95|nr:hypothetical protein [Methylobacterium sp. C1]